MTTESKDQQEPSMEEILSSIRRIIADEEAEEGKSDEDLALGAAEARSGPAHDDEDDDEDVLELTRVVREGGEVVDLDAEERPERGRSPRPAPADAPEAADAFEDDSDEIELAPADRQADDGAADGSHPSQEDETPVPPKQAAAHALVSDAAASAATGAFARISQAFQRTPPEESIADEGGRTVEQFLEDMIRPLLRQWMDENLPKIVERLVEKELQKIARRAELL